MLAKLANGALRCSTSGLPPYKLEHDTPSSKRRKRHEEEIACKVNRVELGGSHDNATLALSPEGSVQNSANGALLPPHASLPGVRCSRTCLACTDALLRLGSQSVSGMSPPHLSETAEEFSFCEKLLAAAARSPKQGPGSSPPPHLSETAEEFSLCEKHLAVAARSPMGGPGMLDDGCFPKFSA